MIPAVDKDSRFRLDDSTAKLLADTYGTPLYVIDESHFRERIREYRTAFKSAYDDSEISFASKANSTLALIAIAAQEGCGIDCASEGELRAAFAAGVPSEQCHLHGNNKTEAELTLAIESGIGYIVADNFEEIEAIARMSPAGANPKVVLRLAPGVDPVTHAKIATGQADTKFGFNIADGSAEKATRLCLERGIALIGYHCHVGSQILDTEAQRSGGELIAQFAVKMAERTGFRASYLNFGGGLGVKYTDGDVPPSIREYTQGVVDKILLALKGSGLSPRLGQEPGRSLVSDSAVTLYRVGVVKQVPAKAIGTRTYVSVDGGLSDNPRPALYGSRYTVLPVAKAGEKTQTVTVCGKHCETDNLFENIELPVSTGPGDLLQVLSTGAYNASMANQYNRYPRPVAVLKRLDGTFSVVQRAETWDEMFARESVPQGLNPKSEGKA